MTLLNSQLSLLRPMTAIEKTNILNLKQTLISEIKGPNITTYTCDCGEDPDS